MDSIVAKLTKEKKKRAKNRSLIDGMNWRPLKHNYKEYSKCMLRTGCTCPLSMVYTWKYATRAYTYRHVCGGGGGGHSTSSNSNSDFFFFVIDYMDENMLQYGGVCMGFWVNKSSKCVFIILCNNQSL